MRLIAGLSAVALSLGCAFAQNIISAHSGVVHYVQGRAFLNDTEVEIKFGQLPEIRENQLFRTEEGLAEVLLTPGVFLRMPENSSIRMVSNRLTDTRIEVLSGSAMIEADEILKDNSIMLLYKGSTMLLVKKGLYRLDTQPARFQTFEGEAIVKGESGQVTLHAGRQTPLNGVLMAENFDKKAVDDLYSWSSRRSASLSKASLSSALGVRSGSGAGSGWLWNPMFGLYTFVPSRGILYSPFGWGFFSPYAAYNYYYSGPSYYGGTGTVQPRTASFTPYSASQLGYDNWAGGGRVSSGGYSSGVSSGGGSVGSGGSVGGGAVSGGGDAGRTGGGVAGGGGGRGR